MSGFEPFPTWVNGTLYGPGEGRLSTDDVGFQAGVAVFDGLLFEDGHRYFQTRHLERFEQGARALEIPWPLRWDPAEVLAAYCDALGRDAFIRFTVTQGVPGEGPGFIVGARAITLPPAEGVRVAIAERRIPLDPTQSLKTTNRIPNRLSREAAQRRGAWDALLRSSEGDVVEGTICNLFTVRDQRVLTPAVERGCLPGVLRGLVLEELSAAGVEVGEGRVELADLESADEVFLTNTSGRAFGVLEIEASPGFAGRRLPGAEGRFVTALRARIAARERADRREPEGPRGAEDGA